METVAKSFKQVVNKTQRSISNIYTQGNYRVEVETYFYKNSKAYVAMVREARIEGSMVVTCFQFGGSGGDFREKILTQATDRYNFKALEALHAEAVETASATIGRLLMKGKTNTQIEEEK